MGDKVKNTVIVLEPTTETVEEFLSSLEKRQQVEIIRSQSHEEVVQITKQFQPCMVVACIHGAPHIPSRTDMLKKLEGSIKYGLIKTLIVSKEKNRQLPSTFTGLGVTDFIEEPVPVRTLQFKANLQLKAIETVRRQQDLKKASQEKIVFKTAGDGAAAAGGAPAAKPAPALSLAQDFFLFRNSGVKKIGKKMVLELDGPDPGSGEWTEHKSDNDGKTRWRWQPVTEEPGATRGDGWVHEGDKPQFQEKTGRWSFASEKPRLGYRQGGKEVAAKVSTDERGQVAVAADSPAAEKNIKKSKEHAILLKQEKIFAEESARAEAAAKRKAAEQARAEAIAAADAEAAERDAAERAAKKPKPAGYEAEEETSAASGKEVKSAAEEEDTPGGETKQKTAKADDVSKQLDFLGKKAKGNAAAMKELSEDEAAAKAKKSSTISPLKLVGEGDSEESSGDPVEEARQKAQAKAHKEKEDLARLRAELDGEIDAGTENEDAAGKAIKAKTAASLDDPEDELSPTKSAGSRLGKKTAGPEADAGAEGEEGGEREEDDRLAKKRKEERAEKRKKIYEQIQGILAEPTPATLSEEEEAAMRAELGIPADQPISARDLARKSHLARIQKLKEKLLDLGGESDDAAPPGFSVHDLAEEKKERRGSWDSIAQEKLKGIQGHSDADLSEEETEREGLGKKRRKDKKGMSLLPEGSSGEKQSTTLEDIFQNGRKDATEESADSPAKSAKKTAAEAEVGSIQQSPHLGIFVAVSNALASCRDKRKGMSRVLKSIEISLGDCEASFAFPPEGETKLAPRELTATGEAQPKRMLNLSTGCVAPIKRKTGETEQILGYLHLAPAGERLQFQREEKETLQKVATMVWPLVSGILAKNEKEKKAA